MESGAGHASRRIKWFEQDAYTPWRKVMIWRAGDIKKIKKLTHRRERRERRRETRRALED